MFWGLTRELVVKREGAGKLAGECPSAGLISHAHCQP